MVGASVTRVLSVDVRKQEQVSKNRQVLHEATHKSYLHSVQLGAVGHGGYCHDSACKQRVQLQLGFRTGKIR